MSSSEPEDRCPWPGRDPLYVDYHDQEWGVPEFDGRALWEKLVLDGFQAGLAWITILRKRDAFREAFAGFDPEAVARFGDGDVARLMANAGVVRARTKIEATIGNARAFLAMRDAGEDFSSFVWGRLEGRTIQNAWRAPDEVPTSTPFAQDLSCALKSRGFKFAGPVIVYAWMQATGQVNDHLASCFRHAELGGAKV